MWRTTASSAARSISTVHGAGREAIRRWKAGRARSWRTSATGRTYVVVEAAKGRAVLADSAGNRHRVVLRPGMFVVDGRPVDLVAPAVEPAAPTVTRSGSVAVPSARAVVAKGSRILVEGRHDAELLEHVWGDDLRQEGIVVEPLHGMDDLVAAVRAFEPGPGRRLGILLDHLVEGTKEWHAARAVDHDHVLIRGHRFVDVWATILPEAVGIAAWPDVPRGTPWKKGVCTALGVADPIRFWPEVLGNVGSYADLSPSLVGAVEELIDFVTE